MSASHIKNESKIGVERLRNVCHADKENSERTLDISSQRCSRMDNPSFPRRHYANYGTLRCKRLDGYFFIDTLVSTKTFSVRKEP